MITAFQFYNSLIKRQIKCVICETKGNLNSIIVWLKASYNTYKISKRRFQFYNSLIKRSASFASSVNTSTFQFYNSLIKSVTLPCFSHSSQIFQFYNSLIKRWVHDDNFGHYFTNFNSIIVWLKDGKFRKNDNWRALFQFYNSLIKRNTPAEVLAALANFNSIIVWLKGILVFCKRRKHLFQFYNSLIKSGTRYVISLSTLISIL